MKIIPRAEPFFFPGNSTGCLLIHGFTGAPFEMRGLGEYLSGQGYTVLGPRLAGHGTCPADMVRSRWGDWAASVEDAWHLLRGTTERVFVIGLSMGGVLALRASAHFPVAGTVAMSTPFELPPDKRLRLLKYLWRFMPYATKAGSDWQDSEAEKNHIAYPKYPTRSLLELKKLLADMRASLPNLTKPVLLMHSRSDGGVAPENMPKIYAQVGGAKNGGAKKEMVWLENSGHVITRDIERETVFRVVGEFIEKQV